MTWSILVKSGTLTYKFNFLYEPRSCADKIIVEKYVISGLVCYKMMLKSNWSGASIKDSKGIGNMYSRESAFFAPSDPGFLMSVLPNQTSFQHFDTIHSIMYAIDNYPWFEFPLSQMRSRGYDRKTGNDTTNMFGSHSSSITIIKLRSPYKNVSEL